MVPLTNNARQTLGWYVEDVWSHFDDDHARHGAPLFPSERKNADGTSARVGDEALRASLVGAAARHLPDWPDRVTPHVLRHFCASQLYSHGMDLIAIQETLGHAWIATTMGYVHVHRSHRRRLDGRAPTRRPAEGADDMRWNLRLAAANRGIWKASECQRLLAERGLVVSAGKISGLWAAGEHQTGGPRRHLRRPRVRGRGAPGPRA